MENGLDQATAGGETGGVGAMSVPAYDYDRFSKLSGELTEPPAGEPYRVASTRLAHWRPVRTAILASVAVVFVGGFLLWLMQPSHWPHGGGSLGITIADYVMAVNTGIIGLFTFINVATMCRASLMARNPVPVHPEAGSRVAFVTTIVPSKEPISIVRRTLTAAREIRHDGTLDVWLLDEGNDPAVQEMCDELGVCHFSRKGVEAYNQQSGPFKTKTKHGNYNSWLDSHGAEYDFMISVDSDHVPQANFGERFLGYFRDPDVAFVVGPQVYGNYDGFVTKSAESQQFLFHSLLQRAGNRTRTPMFVGTNNAVRLAALVSIGGLRDSITEDLATSLAFHTARNPDTGSRWTSVYTPDVIAVGEGPGCFTDFFSQQYRWSRGSNDELLKRFWRIAHRLSPRQFLNYCLLMAYYPTTAIAWTLGVFNSILYMTLHTVGVKMSVHLWLMLYVDVAAIQTGLYFWNRRHNVSPHESQGSRGVAGMFISALSVPVYVSSLLGSVLRRKSGFVVTAKGDTAQADSLATFSKHLRWAGVIALALVASLLLGNKDPWMYLWSGLSLVVCLLPIAIWRVSSGRPSKRARRGAKRSRAAHERTGALAGGAEPA
jgi:cellulose synthase/poly-beta-1,6-N-acetylglucosamine synthase-like glycosyltransferase